MKGKPWPQALRDEAVRRYVAGESSAVVASELGVGTSTVTHWIGTAGVARGDNAGWQQFHRLRREQIARVGLDAPEVCRQAGISYRQLDYWTRTGLVTASLPAQGTGTARGYTAQEAEQAAGIARLLRAGVDLRAIRTYGLDGVSERLREALDGSRSMEAVS